MYHQKSMNEHGSATAKTKIPRAVAIGLILAVILDTFIQMYWKMAVIGLPEDVSALTTLRGALASRYFYYALFGFALQMVNWMRVLASADLSFAQPFTALGYITVLVFSHHSFHEKFSFVKIVGITLILSGIFLISQTPHNTSHAEERS